MLRGIYLLEAFSNRRHHGRWWTDWNYGAEDLGSVMGVLAGEIVRSATALKRSDWLLQLPWSVKKVVNWLNWLTHFFENAARHLQVAACL